MTRRGPMTPRYRNSRTNSEVRRASQVHQVPHIGLPQIAPVSSVTAVNMAPTGALVMARISEILMRQTTAMNALAAMKM